MLGEGDKNIIFSNVKDIWNYINLLVEESENRQNKGSSFTTANAIYEQLPFFCCYNKILNEKSQNDISRYIYCIETNTQPFPGSYGDTPVSWKEKYFIIKQTMNLRDKQIMEKARKNARL